MAWQEESRLCLAIEVDELEPGQLDEALGFTQQLMKEVGYMGMLCMLQQRRDIMTGRFDLKSWDVISRCVQELSPGVWGLILIKQTKQWNWTSKCLQSIVGLRWLVWVRIVTRYITLQDEWSAERRWKKCHGTRRVRTWLHLTSSTQWNAQLKTLVNKMWNESRRSRRSRTVSSFFCHVSELRSFARRPSAPRNATPQGTVQKLDYLIRLYQTHSSGGQTDLANSKSHIIPRVQVFVQT